MSSGLTMTLAVYCLPATRVASASFCWSVLLPAVAAMVSATVWAGRITYQALAPFQALMSTGAAEASTLAVRSSAMRAVGMAPLTVKASMAAP